MSMTPAEVQALARFATSLTTTSDGTAVLNRIERLLGNSINLKAVELQCALLLMEALGLGDDSEPASRTR